MKTTINIFGKSARTSSTVHCKNLAHLVQVTVPRKEYDDSEHEKVTFAFQKGEKVWKVEVDIEVTLHPDNHTNIFHLVTNSDKDVRFVEVKYTTTWTTCDSFTVSLRSLDGVWTAHLAYADTFQGFKTIGGHGRVMRMGDHSFRSTDYDAIISSLGTRQDWGEAPQDQPNVEIGSSVDTIIPDGYDIEPQGEDSSPTKRKVCVCDAVCLQCFEVSGASACGNTHVKVDECTFVPCGPLCIPREALLWAYNDMYAYIVRWDSENRADSHSRFMWIEECYACKLNSYKIKNLRDAMVDTADLFPLCEHPAEKQARTLEYVKSEVSNRGYKRQKQLKTVKLETNLDFGIEPQMFDTIAAAFSTAKNAAEGINHVARAIDMAATEGVRMHPDTLSRFDELIACGNDLLNKGTTHHVEVSVPELTFDNIFSYLYEHRGKIGIFVLFMLIFVLLLRGSDSTIVTALLGLGAVLINHYHGEYVKRIWYGVQCAITLYYNRVEPQSFEFPWIESILKGAYLFIFKDFAKDVMEGHFATLFKKVVNAPSALKGASESVDFWVHSFQDIVNSTIEFFGSDYRFCFAAERYPQVREIADRVALFMDSYNKKGSIVLPMAQTSRRLQGQITDLQLKYKHDRDFTGSRTLLNQLRSKLEMVDRELELRGAGKDVTRVAPKAFLFMGKPGIGKSYLLRNLCTMALYHLFSEDPAAVDQIKAKQVRDFIYTRNSDDKFWEGYYNQPIVYLDEVAMQNDTSATNTETNEYSSFIKMVNDVTYPLIMANVEKKGMTEFDSELILGTTNMHQFKIDSINNRDAYDRRWCTYEVEVDPKYGEVHKLSGTDTEYYRPDWSKIDPQGVEFKALSKFLRFRRRVTLFRQGYEGDWITMDQLVETIRRSLDERSVHKVERQDHEDFVHNYFFKQERRSDSPGSYPDVVPQGQDCDGLTMCKCVHCVERFMCFGPYMEESRLSDFSDEQKDCYSDVLKTPWHVLEENFYKGFRSVVNTDSPGYRKKSERMCAALIKGVHKIHYGPAIMYVHGQMIKSAYVDMMAPPLSSRILGYCSDAVSWATYSAKALWREVLSEETRLLWDHCKRFLRAFLVSFTVIKLLLWLTAKDKPQKKGKRQVSPRKEEIEAQSFDTNADEILEKVTNRNVYLMGDDFSEHLGYAMFITDHIIVLPRHYVERWKILYAEKDSFNVHFRRVGDGVKHQLIKFDVAPMITEKNVCYPCGKQSDLVAIYLTNRCIQRHASVRKYLIPSEDYGKHGMCVMPSVEDGAFTGLLDGEYVVDKPQVTYPIKGGSATIMRPIEYRIQTQVGDCGLPVAIQNPQYRCEKIFGIHTAGYRQQAVGISHPLTVGMYDAIVDHFGEQHSLIHAQYRTEANVLIDLNRSGGGWNDLAPPPQEKKIPGKVNLGYVEPANLPSSTCIRRSPLHGKVGYQPKTIPAHLREFERDGVKIDPARIATEKYHHSIEALDLDVLDCCVNHYTDLVVNHPLSKLDERVGRRVLTFHEAVAGIDGVDGLDGLPRKTSAGYPWVKMLKGKGKTDFFGSDGDYVFDSPECKELEGYVNDIVTSAKQGERLMHVFMDFHKDERRPREKVLAGKTRKVSACSVETSICVRMYFGAFVCYYMQNRIYNQSAVGVNVYSSEWDQIANYLGPNSRYIAGDFSNYDGKLPYCIMIRFLDTVTAFYRDKGSEAERVREVLFQELVNSRHLLNGVIYEWVGSNASGNPLTTVLNSWCNNVILRYATLKVLGADNMMQAPSKLRQFDDSLRFMVYGDDNLIAVDRQSIWAPLLTQDSYTQALAEMGFEYTDEMKTGAELSQDRSLEEVSFLKRKWARTSIHPKRKWLSPLDTSTILESIQWTKKKDFLHDHVRDNCLNMILELSQHDKTVFDEWTPKIVEACQEHLNYSPIPNDYRNCQLTVITREKLY